MIACYTLALKFTPAYEKDLRATILSNRSLMYIKQGKAEEALKDAQDCVDSKPNWAKVCMVGVYLRLIDFMLSLFICIDFGPSASLYRVLLYFRHSIVWALASLQERNTTKR